MRRWAFLLLVIYALLLLALPWPLIVLTGVLDWAYHGKSFPDLLPDASNLMPTSEAWWWGSLAVLVLAQACLLWVPVRLGRGRPLTRGSIWVTATAAGLASGILFLGYGLSVAELFSAGDEAFLAVIAFATLLWGAWAFLFRCMERGRAPEAWIARLRQRLLAGSVLELLVAVPSHVWVRRRDACCAGMATGAGIACGVAVMLMSFGPGVLFLYAARIRRKRGEASS